MARQSQIFIFEAISSESVKSVIPVPLNEKVSALRDITCRFEVAFVSTTSPDDICYRC